MHGTSGYRDGTSNRESLASGGAKRAKASLYYGDADHRTQDLRHYLTVIMKNQKLYNKLDKELIRLILRDGPQAETQNMSLIIKTLWNEIGIQLAEREATAQYIKSSVAAKRAYAERLACLLILRTRFIGLLSARDQHVRRLRSMVNTGGILRRSFITSFDEVRLITLALIEVCLGIYLCTGKRHEPYKLGFDAPRGQDIVGAILAEELFSSDVMAQIADRYLDRPDIVEKFTASVAERSASALVEERPMNGTLNVSDLLPPPKNTASPPRSEHDRLVDSYSIQDICNVAPATEPVPMMKTVTMLFDVAATLTQLLELPCTTNSLASLMFLTGARPANIQSHIGFELLSTFTTLMPVGLNDPAHYIEVPPDRTMDALLEYFSNSKRLTHYLVPHPHTSEFVRRRAASLDTYFVFSLLIFEKFRYNAEVECQRRMTDAYEAISPTDKYPKPRSALRQSKSVFSRAISVHRRESRLQTQNMIEHELFYSQNYDVHSGQSSFASPSTGRQAQASQQPQRSVSLCKDHHKHTRSSSKCRAPSQTRVPSSCNTGPRTKKPGTVSTTPQSTSRAPLRSASTAKKPSRSESVNTGKRAKRKVVEAQKPATIQDSEPVGVSNAYITHPPPKYYPMSSSRCGSPAFKKETPAAKKHSSTRQRSGGERHSATGEPLHGNYQEKNATMPQPCVFAAAPESPDMDKTPGLMTSAVSDQVMADGTRTPEEAAYGNQPVNSVVHNSKARIEQNHTREVVSESDPNSTDHPQKEPAALSSSTIEDVTIAPANDCYHQREVPEAARAEGNADPNIEEYDAPDDFMSDEEKRSSPQKNDQSSPSPKYDFDDFDQDEPNTLDITVKSADQVLDEIYEPSEEAIVEDGALKQTEATSATSADGRPMSRGMGRSTTRSQTVRSGYDWAPPTDVSPGPNPDAAQDIADGTDDAPGVSLGVADDQDAEFDNFDSF